MAHDKVNTSLIVDGPWKWKLAAHITSKDNVSADKDHTKKRLQQAGVGPSLCELIAVVGIKNNNLLFFKLQLPAFQNQTVINFLPSRRLTMKMPIPDHKMLPHETLNISLSHLMMMIVWVHILT